MRRSWRHVWGVQVGTFIAGSWRLAPLLWLASGCADSAPAHTHEAPGESRWVALIDAESWTPTPRDRDPLADHAPADALCLPGAWRIDSGVVDVDTGSCPYLSLEAPLERTVEEGVVVRWQFWHLDLFAEPAANAHVALLGDRRVWWEETLPIPSAARVYEVTFPVPMAAPAGTPLRLHLHNHGVNEWRFAAPTIQSPPRETTP